MERVTLHVPEALNDGSAVRLELFESFEDELLEVALEARDVSGTGEPGFTVLHNVAGVWVTPTGAKSRDPLRLYLLDVVDLHPAYDRVLALAERIKLELDQDAVYVTVQQINAAAVASYIEA